MEVFVTRTGVTGEKVRRNSWNFNLKLESNSRNLLRNIGKFICKSGIRMYKEGKRRTFMVVDIPLSYLLK